MKSSTYIFHEQPGTRILQPSLNNMSPLSDDLGIAPVIIGSAITAGAGLVSSIVGSRANKKANESAERQMQLQLQAQQQAAMAEAEKQKGTVRLVVIGGAVVTTAVVIMVLASRISKKK
jgi:hypothetical protein